MLVFGPPVSATADSPDDTRGATARLHAPNATTLAAMHKTLKPESPPGRLICTMNLLRWINLSLRAGSSPT